MAADQPIVLVVDEDATRAGEIVDELGREVAGVTVQCVRPTELASRPHDDRVALAIVSDDGPLDAMLAALGSRVAPHARILIVADRAEVDGVDDAITAGRLHGIVGRPWTRHEFGRHLRAQLQRALEAGGLPLLDDRTDERSTEFEDLALPDHDAAERLVGALDAALGRRPRVVVAPGTVLVREGDEVNGIWVVLDGGVALTRRGSHGEESLHESSSGPVVGLLSFAQHRRAFFTVRTRSRVRAVFLTVEQLDQAMRHAPAVSSLLASVLLRSLAQRLRHSESLQLEVRDLNRDLAAERDRLATAMARLQAAELQLVESARFATLGELAAGIAHELNNPAAALQRGAAHVGDDLAALLAPGEVAWLREALDAPPPAAADARRARRELERRLGDPGLADRFVQSGVLDPDEAEQIAAAGPAEVERRLRVAALATALRNVTTAAERIAALVASLRAYVRGGGAGERTDVDVVRGIEDTLLLLGHQLDGIAVERHVAASVPTVAGNSGELNQVWTNLLANAAEALDRSGRITVTVDVPDPDHVRVRIADDGPGIAAADLHKIFEPRFTTKRGRVEYGLGLGLSISHRIVQEHGGTIAIDSDPTGTVATVVLPVRHPDDEGKPL